MPTSLSTFLSTQTQGLQGVQGGIFQGTQGVIGSHQGVQGTVGEIVGQGTQATLAKNAKGLSMLAWLTPG
jgi:hypothetical protein